MKDPSATWLALLVVSLAVLLSWPFFARPLRPWPDQGVVLAAAVRHAGGMGLTNSRPTPDLARPGSEQLFYFPPFYPLFVSVCLRAGLNVELVVKALNAAALLLGSWGWCRLATSSLRSPAARWLFALILVLAGGALVPKGGTMDYLLWAAVPWWAERLLAAARSDTRASLRASFAAGLIGALLVGVRWAAVFLVPAAGFFWLSGGAGPQGRVHRLKLAIASAAPLSLTYAAIVAGNRWVAGGQGSLMQYLTPHWDWSRLATLYPLETLFAVPLGIEPLLTRIWRGLDPGRTSWQLAALFRLALPGVALVILLRSVRRERGMRDRAPLMWLAAATWLSLLAFLTWMSLRYTWSFANWSYLKEPRYFRPVWPLASLAWLALLDGLPGTDRVRQVGLGLLAVAAVYILQAQARWANGAARPEESWELVQRVRAVEREPGLHVVFDNDISDYVVHAGPRLLARYYPDATAVASLATTAPIRLWLVRRPDEPSAYVLDPEFDFKRFEAMRMRFDPRLVWTSSTAKYELYAAELQPSP